MSYKKKPDIGTLSDIQYLETLNTRELLSMLQNTRSYGDYTISAQGRQNRYHTFTIRQDDLREVLKSRPHVPNKNERRGLTKLKIKEGK